MILPPPPHTIPPPPPPPSAPGKGTTIVVVVFVSCTGVFFVAIVMAALWCFLKKKKKMVRKAENVHIDEHRKVIESKVQGSHGTETEILSVCVDFLCQMMTSLVGDSGISKKCVA
uniref:Uncharacterized protein n=1 Tax=Lactuca sativa TaxID=4236 RepID=A0A9R1XRS0_LACSA|nr:hypothetical protein LSAT_V11C100004790 [Lactuca sativa]